MASLGRLLPPDIVCHAHSAIVICELDYGSDVTLRGLGLPTRRVTLSNSQLVRVRINGVVTESLRL